MIAIIAVLAGLLALGEAAPAWARPGLQPQHQTVPTLPPTPPRPTPRPTATDGPLPPGPPTATPERPTGPDLRLQWLSSTQMLLAGQVFQLTAETTNAGPADVGPVTLRVPLPAALELVAVRGSPGTSSLQERTVILTAENLPAGAVWLVELAVQVRPTTPRGVLVPCYAEIEGGGQTWRSRTLVLPLPPAELPRTGGMGLTP